MPLPAKAFQHWLHGVAPTASTADICRISGIKRTTLAQQLVRGKVAETTLVSISRALKRSPLADLASFDSFTELAEQPQPPTPAELVSQIATMDLLRAVISRSSPAYGGFGDNGSSLTPALERRPARHLRPELGGRDRRRRTAAPGIGRHRRRSAELFGPVDREPAVPGTGGRNRPRGWRRIHGRTRRHRPD